MPAAGLIMGIIFWMTVAMTHPPVEQQEVQPLLSPDVETQELLDINNG